MKVIIQVDRHHPGRIPIMHCCIFKAQIYPKMAGCCATIMRSKNMQMHACTISWTHAFCFDLRATWYICSIGWIRLGLLTISSKFPSGQPSVRVRWECVPRLSVSWDGVAGQVHACMNMSYCHVRKLQVQQESRGHRTPDFQTLVVRTACCQEKAFVTSLKEGTVYETEVN